MHRGVETGTRGYPNPILRVPVPENINIILLQYSHEPNHSISYTTKYYSLHLTKDFN